jgi:hypothetical protein
MEKIYLEGTHKTPYVLADPDKGQIELKGRSNPENSAEFYKPLVDWLDNYADSNIGDLDLTIDLEHFNTSSSKCIMDVLKRLKKLNQANRKVNVSWYYEEDDEEMLEAAETYESMTDLKFKIISKPVSDLD